MSISLTQFAIGSTNWTAINTNWQTIQDAINNDLIKAGTLAARPAAAAGNAGFLYFATDDNGGTLYRSNGSSWTQVARGVTQGPTGSAGGDLTGTYPDPTIASGAVTNAKIANSTIDLTSKVTGALPVANGGTAGATATDARTNLGAAASGANTDIASVYLDNTGLKVKDTNASHGLTIKPGSDLTADRILTVSTGDSARSVTLTGDTTLSGTNTGDQTITLTGEVTGSGTGSFATTLDKTAITGRTQETTVADDDQLLISDTSESSGALNRITREGFLASAPFPANSSNQFIVGTSALPSTNWFGGKGVTNTTPTDFTINGSGGSGIDCAGADLQLAAGKGTGAGAQGLVGVLNAILTTGGTTTLQSLSTTQQVVGGVIFSSITSKTIANTTDEDTLIGTIVGSKDYGAWRNGRVIRITAWGTLSTDTAASANTAVIIKFKLGSVDLTLSASTQLGASRVNCPFTLEVYATITSSTTVRANGILRFLASGALIGVNLPSTSSSPTLSSPQTIDLKWDWQTADSENTVTCDQVVCEILN